MFLLSICIDVMISNNHYYNLSDIGHNITCCFCDNTCVLSSNTLLLFLITCDCHCTPYWDYDMLNEIFLVVYYIFKTIDYSTNN